MPLGWPGVVSGAWLLSAYFGSCAFCLAFSSSKEILRAIASSGSFVGLMPPYSENWPPAEAAPVALIPASSPCKIGEVNSMSVIMLIPRGTSRKWLLLELSHAVTSASSFETFSGLAKLITSIATLFLLSRFPRSSHAAFVSLIGCPTNTMMRWRYDLFILCLSESWATFIALNRWASPSKKW